MCGIIGYVGHHKPVPIILDGLRRLEYRGYDSAGLAVVDENNALSLRRAEGKLHNLEEAVRLNPVDGWYGIGHTRWATHGRPTEENAHPHRDCHGDAVVIHNGIVENYLALKRQLESEGHVFVTETDGASFTATATGAGPINFSSLAGTLTIAGPTSSGSGPIAIQADQVSQSANLTTGGTGAITVSALGGPIVMAGAAQSVAGGDITYQAAGDITLGRLDAGGAVMVTSSSGSILDGNGAALNLSAGGAAVGFIWWLMRLGNFSNYLYVSGILALGGLFFGMVVALHYRFMPVGRLRERREAM